jgi:hypothetical protein
MKKIILATVALGMALGFAMPAFAKPPQNQADCEKAKMKWDDTSKKCTKGSM